MCFHCTVMTATRLRSSPGNEVVGSRENEIQRIEFAFDRQQSRSSLAAAFKLPPAQRKVWRESCDTSKVARDRRASPSNQPPAPNSASRSELRTDNRTPHRKEPFTWPQLRRRPPRSRRRRRPPPPRRRRSNSSAPGLWLGPSPDAHASGAAFVVTVLVRTSVQQRDRPAANRLTKRFTAGLKLAPPENISPTRQRGKTALHPSIFSIYLFASAPTPLPPSSAV